MKTFWKQFVEWAIKLKNNPFVSTQLKLTLLYTVVIICGIIFYLTLLNREFIRETKSISKELNDPNRRERFVMRATRLTTRTLFSIQREDVFMFFVTIVISYSLAGVALKPLKKVVENHKNFLAEASHELRTPLSNIKTDMEVFLQQDMQEMADQKKYMYQRRLAASSNINELEKIQLILDNLLFLSRENTYQEIFISIPFLMDTIVDQAVIRLRDLAYKKKIKLVIINNSRVLLHGDPMRIEQAVVNVFKNAIKYTDKAGQITIRVKNNNNIASISIQDTGIGISKKDLPYIFKRFFRGSNQNIKNSEGVGLGLAITKAIVEKHRGKIYIKSKQGKGTTVTMMLPFNKSEKA